jgi:hypothetical protein
MEKKKREFKRKRLIPTPVNDGTNIPVPDKNAKQIPSASEAALFKQAEKSIRRSA